MEMQREQAGRINDIVSTMNCSKGFPCRQSGFTKLVKVKDIGIDGFVECHEKQVQDCEFSVPFGNKRYCECPLRVYLAKELKI